MARMLPDLSDADLKRVQSSAEQRLYVCCRDSLPASWTVLFSTAWVGTTPTGRKHDGEADFIILVEGLGVLVIEVKGGGVAYDPTRGRWQSTDRHGTRHEIKDPFSQATKEKHQTLRILQEDHRWRRCHPGRVLMGHAVFLTDIEDVSRVSSPQSPAQILGGRHHLGDLTSWVESVMNFWAQSDDRWTPLSPAAISAAESILHTPIEVRPLTSTLLKDEEEARIKLTQQQSRVLRGLGARRRAMICGGAGTGKTLLAAQRARELAAAGKRTLFLCYNNLLADHVKEMCSTDGIVVSTFHQLCSDFAKRASDQSGRPLIDEAKRAYPSSSKQHLFDRQLPHALVLALDILPDRFDAVIIDEGQDFKNEFWFPIEMLLEDEHDSYLIVFLDHNQCLYTRSSEIPIREEPFELTVNCRNSAPIHEVAYRYYEGTPTDPGSEMSGSPVRVLSSPSIATQAKAIHNEIVALISKEGLEPVQIGVLVCGRPKRPYIDHLIKKPLPNKSHWRVEAEERRSGVWLDTVRRFKGLEVDILYLWGLDTLPADERREELYVGLSRAKSRLILAGTTEHCREIIDD